MIKARVTISQEKIKEFCEKHHIRKLSLFGSVLDEMFTEKSDIDILVEFEAGMRVGFLSLASLEMELSQILERRVDLRTPAELSRYFRGDVLKNAQVQYEKK